MKIRHIPALLILASASALANASNQPANHRPVSIPFVDMGGIRDWRPIGRDGIAIQGLHHNDWYEASFFSPCYGLDQTEAVGFVTGPSGSLNQFSSILVNGQRCHFKSLKKVDQLTINANSS